MTENSPFCNCLFFSTSVLSRHFTRLAEEAFSETGWGPSYAFILLRVNASPGISPSELSNQLALTPSTITRLVEKLEAKQMVTRTVAGRKTSVLPTKKATDLNPQLKEAWKKLNEQYMNILGKEMASELGRIVGLSNKIFEEDGE